MLAFACPTLLVLTASRSIIATCFLNAAPSMSFRPTLPLALALACAVPLAHAGVNVATGTPGTASAAASADDTVDRFIVKLRDNRADPRTSMAAVGAGVGE